MGGKKEQREEKHDVIKELLALELVATEAFRIREELRCICRELTGIHEQFRKFNEFVRFPKLILISQQGEEMGVINGIAVGGTGTFTETPQPAGSSVGSQVPVWTSSDSANTSLTPSADGSSVNVSVGAGAPVGGSFTLTATVTSADGSQTAAGSANVPYLAGASNFPTSLDITQTA